MEESTKIISSLVPALITSAIAMVQSNACQAIYGKSKISKKYSII